MRARVALCVCLVTTAARGQHDTAAAQAMFDQARESMKRSDYAGACPKFAESQRLDPQPGTLANLALCEDKAGKIASAWTHARESLEQLPPNDGRSPPLRALIARVEKRLPRLSVRLPTDAPKGTKVRRDDIELGAASLGVALPVDPGDHTIVVDAPGRKATTLVIRVAEGATKEVQPDLGDAVPASEPRVPRAASSDASPSSAQRTIANPAGSRTTLGYVALGAGGVGAIVGLVTGVVLAGKQSTVEASCDTSAKICSGPDTQAARDAASSGRSLLPVYYGGLGLAVIGAGVGAYLLLTGDEASTAVGVGAGNVAVRGRF